MRRRAIIGLLGGATGWPLIALAQQVARTPRIGVLLLFAESDPEAAVRVRALKQGLQDLGWIEGHNIRIEFRFAAGDVRSMYTLAKELADLPVDVIVTNVGHSAGWFKPVTIPIVYAMAHSWSLGPSGLITSLSHPSGNVTGFTTFEPSIVGKWLEFLKAIAPHVTRVGFMFNSDATPIWETWLRQFDAATSDFAVEPVTLNVHDLGQVQSGLVALGQESGSGLVIFPDTFTVANHPTIETLAMEQRIPACYPYRYFTTSGGLMSYGPNGAQVFRQAASYVDRILKGTNPGDLPIQQPNAFELVINLKTAKAMDLTVPPWLLARADEVIE
jgi:putative ABC transport system substrate-binding protein